MSSWGSERCDRPCHNKYGGSLECVCPPPDYAPDQEARAEPSTNPPQVEAKCETCGSDDPARMVSPSEVPGYPWHCPDQFHQHAPDQEARAERCPSSWKGCADTAVLDSYIKALGRSEAELAEVTQSLQAESDENFARAEQLDRDLATAERQREEANEELLMARIRAEQAERELGEVEQEYEELRARRKEESARAEQSEAERDIAEVEATEAHAELRALRKQVAEHVEVFERWVERAPTTILAEAYKAAADRARQILSDA